MEPDNADAQAWLVRAVAADPTVEPLTTTIGDERKLNTFFRLDNPIIRSAVDCLECSDKEVFVALRSRRDNW
jgi:hydroxyacylglutathione hydrolase